MSAFHLYASVAAALFALGLYGLLARRHLVRRIIALNLMSSGVFLLFGAAATRGAPRVPDPVPHALVITGIVVAVCATALALTLAARIRAHAGAAHLPEDSPDVRPR